MAHSQCLMCKYAFGRKCELTNTFILDEIYNNESKCLNFKSLQNTVLDCEDSCCSESKRYEFLNNSKSSH